MSLKIWLPLDGNLENKGCGNYPLTMHRGSLIYHNEGKIGKCFYANGVNTIQIQNIIPALYDISGYSLCAWFYIESNNTTHSGSAIISAGNWNNEVLNLALSDWSTDHYTKLRISGTNWGRTYAYNFVKNKWYHVVICSDQNKTYAYVDGLLIGDTAASFLPSNISGNNIDIGGATYYGGMQFFGRINDVRIYDHCLSPLEVKQISQGLILHYKFEIGTSELKTSIPSTNIYSYPTFNTSTGTGGWSHWGASGHSGHYGQNTDKNYIFNKVNSYSHWVSNDESATKNYLLYQSPAFEGGHRSLQCIIKEENGKPITQDICYPAWNARNGGTPIGLWTSIIPLNDNFYLCKCQNIQQDGSNDLVGIYVKIGYKVYFSECYLENDAQKCSSCFSSIEKFQDSSGYNHNGSLYKYDTNGNFDFIKDTPRYDTCIYIDSENNTTNTASGTVYIYGDCKLTNPTQMTIAFWCKPIAGYGGGTSQGQFCTTNIAFGSNAGSDYQASAMNHRDGAVDTNDSASSTQCRPTINFIANEWHHYAFIYNGKDAKSYKDGILQDTKSFSESKSLDSFIGVIIGFSKAGGVWRSNKSYYSDFRVYCTALDQNDIKKLYNVNMSIDNFNNIHTFEANEILGQNKITKTGIFKNYMVEPYLVLKDGSKWKLMLYHCVDNGNNLFTSSNASYCNDIGLYSRLKDINNYTYNGIYEFYVLQDDKQFRWTQTSAPTASSIAGKTVVQGYNDPVNGLAKGTTSNTYIGYNAWWGACGCWTSYSLSGKKGIPGFGSHDVNGLCLNYLALYVRVNDNNFKIENSINYANQLIEK